MKIVLERPHQASEEIDTDTSIRFVLVNGDVLVSLTGGGHLRLKRKGLEPLIITPLDSGMIVVR